MDAPSSLPRPSSALPRPMSKLPKLPVPRPASTYIGRPVSPEHRASQSPSRQSVSGLPPPHRYSTASTASRPSVAPSSWREPVPGSPQRRPLHPSSRPQSRHDSATSSSTSELPNGQLRIKPQRHPSQQENAIEVLASPGGSEASSEATDSQSPISALKRRPRPSLSDRTLESLSGIPTSPNRRSSAFFSPGSPVFSPSRPQSRSSRPPSALSQGTAAKFDATTTHSNGFARPASPSKRPGSNGIAANPAMGMPARKSFSSTLPKPGGVSGIATPNHLKRASVIPFPAPKPAPLSTARTGPRPPATSQVTNARQRPMSMMGPPPTRFADPGRPRAGTKPANTSIKLTRPNPGPLKPAFHSTAEVEPKVNSEPEPERELEPATTTQAKSSAGFRAQIAKAKAAARVANAKPSNGSAGTNKFDSCDDPFNQGPSAASALDKRIDAARRDGRLNIAAMNLKSVPVEVMHMFDAEAMEASSVTWSETVDLVRFNIGDNEIEEISDDAFPDTSLEQLASGFEAKGNQFGGIEHLDLHGNLLKAIPTGLRRLERLTSLNLSRNKLGNSIFPIITQITTLRTLDLTSNDLTRDVPESISALTNLEILSLSHNKLTSLPGSVRDLVNLHVINLSSNRFDSLPIGSLFSLPSLREVFVASNALTSAFFPMTVDIVRSLTYLDISNNSLASVSFGTELHLPAIQTLNISRNRLFALPNVASWGNLVTLLAEENGLSALPDGFTALKKLKTADFSRNSLRSVEPEVARMDELEMLGLSANPLREKRLLSMSTAQVKEEMRKKLDGGAVES